MIDNNSTKIRILTNVLDILGLINGLLLTTVSACLVSVNYNTLVGCDHRFGFITTNVSDPKYGKYSYVSETDERYGYNRYWNKAFLKSSPPSTQLFIYSAVSLSLFFTGIVLVCLIYMDMLGKLQRLDTVEIDDNSADDNIMEVDEFKTTLGGGDDTDENESFQNWYHYAKYAVLIAFMITVGGAVYAIFTINYFIIIQYPDYYIAANGDLSITNRKSPKGNTNIISQSFFIGGIICTLFFLGMGTAKKHKNMNQIHIMDDKITSN
jgi:hypothetical protein